MIRLIARKLFWGGIRYLLSDNAWMKWRYFIEFGFFPDLNHPARLSEKIQWIKLHERTELRKMAADRLQVREYVQDRVGDHCLIPLLGSWERLTEEVWETLPEAFVLKASHGSGFVKVIENRSDHSYSELRKETDRWLKTDYHRFGREWVYEDLRPTVIAEELILNEESEIPADYKFFCFHGKVKLVQVDRGRFKNQSRNLFNEEFEQLEAELHHPAGQTPIKKPKQFDQAKDLAEKLSEPFSFIRVDLYLPDNRICFGELTNYPGNGFERFCPDSWDAHFGKLLTLESR